MHAVGSIVDMTMGEGGHERHYVCCPYYYCEAGRNGVLV